MIRVTLELVPGGVGVPERLGVIEIGNQVGRTLDTGGRRGDHHFRLFKKRSATVCYDGTIKDFPRLSYHPWNLVKRILDDAARQSDGGVI